MLNVSIEREDCISCGLCISVCPEVFRFSEEDGLSEVYHQPDASQEACAKEAAEGCPVSIIYIEE